MLGGLKHGSKAINLTVGELEWGLTKALCPIATLDLMDLWVCGWVDGWVGGWVGAGRLMERIIYVQAALQPPLVEVAFPCGAVADRGLPRKTGTGVGQMLLRGSPASLAPPGCTLTSARDAGLCQS